ncbi:MAG: hypothetical protein P1V29_11025 [Gammaproteobacteria bacterium]|nr:hypothetical protein [Gammaproteobacteria bacterium]
MMRNFFRTATIAALVSSLIGPVGLAQQAEITQLKNPAPTQVLFVGNSYFYYNDSLHNHVNRLVQAHDEELAERIAYKSATIGGASLSHHDVAAHLQAGKLGLDEPFDLVILQGGSGEPLRDSRRETFKRVAAEHAQTIRATGAEVALYMTPAYSEAHARFDPAMIERIASLYIETANEIDALVIPVGLAFEEAYRRRPEMVLHKFFDGSHPELEGTYLAACVVFATLYGESPVGNSYTYFGEVSDEDALFLQQVAQDVVNRFFAR